MLITNGLVGIFAFEYGATPVVPGLLRYNHRVVDSAYDPGYRIPQYILVVTEAELPTTDVGEGDLAYTIDTDKMWKRTASAWVELGSATGAPTDATYITQTANAGLSAEQALSGLATGIVKVTNGTGVLSTAVAGDFPTLNQNTTGTAANVTGIVGISNGGTGSDVGTITTRQRSLVLSNGDNNNVALGGYTYQRITGPTAAFAITGMAGGADGYMVYLQNSSGQLMTVRHESTSSSAANRISLNSGTDTVLTRILLIYDWIGQRWNVIAFT